MNANELADEIGSILYPYCEEAAIMLRQQDIHLEGQADVIRQQQAEIEALKKENEELSALCVEFNVLRKAQEK